MKNHYLLECCVDCAASALEAEKGGADRLELCSGLVIGGLTPSASLLAQVKSKVHLPVNVLIRPRFGDFLYTREEMELMRSDITLLKEYGADGFVIGCLRADGTLDIEGLTFLMEACGSLPITLHRAFDMCRDPFTSLEAARNLGITTILSSGQKNTCLEGLALLKALHEKAVQSTAHPVQIMAGDGMDAQSISHFLRQTDITAFHMSGKKVTDSDMTYRNPMVSMGTANLDEYSIWQTDAEEVHKAKVELLNYFPASEK